MDIVRFKTPEGENPFFHIAGRGWGDEHTRTLWLEFYGEFKNYKGTLSDGEREGPRYYMASSENACVICKAARLFPELGDSFYDNIMNWRTDPQYTEREKMAIELRDRYLFDHSSLADDWDFWKRLHALFTQEEIEWQFFNAMLDMGLDRLRQIINGELEVCRVVPEAETEAAE